MSRQISSDWRITARKKIQNKPDKVNTKEYILTTREDFTLEEYRQKTEKDHIHRRTCNGQALDHSTNRNREEEVLLHGVRVNRCYKLAKLSIYWDGVNRHNAAIATVTKRKTRNISF